MKLTFVSQVAAQGFAAVLLAVVVSHCGAARGDIFVLKRGGQVEGERVTAAETPQTFVIQTDGMGQVTLERDQVKEFIPQSPAQAEYTKASPTYPDTADGQWQLAEWCREHGLAVQRQTHLERVLELDTNNKDARVALGYVLTEGKWVRQDKIMEERGYVRYKGHWRLPQEVEILEQKRKDDQAEAEWFHKLKTWRQWLDTRDKAPQAKEAIEAIQDPYAVAALASALQTERSRNIKLMYIGALTRIGSSGALSALVSRALDDTDLEIRLSALDELVKHKSPEVVEMFVQALKSKENPRVNRAGMALGRLKDASAVGPLIDALITTHKHIEQPANPGSTTSTFGTDSRGGSSGGISVGGSAKLVREHVMNQDVLDALVAISGANFQFDIKAWKYWYATQQKQPALDARRG